MRIFKPKMDFFRMSIQNETNQKKKKGNLKEENDIFLLILNLYTMPIEYLKISYIFVKLLFSVYVMN